MRAGTYASRVHLAARSEHFRAMLYGGMRESFRETCHEGVELKDVSYVVFLKILEFLYTETVLDIPPRRRRATAHRGGTNVRSPLLQSVKPGLRRGFTERQAAPQCTISRPRAFRSSARAHALAGRNESVRAGRRGVCGRGRELSRRGHALKGPGQ